MSDDDKLHKTRADGSRARDLLNDELLQGAFTELKRTYAEKLLSTSVDQAAAREILYQAHRIVGEVETHLRIVLDRGKIADVQLNDLITIQERRKRFGLI